MQESGDNTSPTFWRYRNTTIPKSVESSGIPASVRIAPNNCRLRDIESPGYKLGYLSCFPSLHANNIGRDPAFVK